MNAGDIIDGYKSDLNDVGTDTWSREQLLRWHNEALCIVASTHPDAYTHRVVVEVTPCTEVQEVCDCVNLRRVIGQCDAKGKVTKLLREVTEKSRVSWTGKKCVTRSAAHEFSTYTLDRTTNALTIAPPAPVGKATYVLVECSFIPTGLVDGDEVPATLCIHNAIIRHYVLWNAKMMDMADANIATEATAHYTAFKELSGMKTSYTVEKK